jgi:type IV secretory pathway VirB10-like protein
MFSKSLAVGLLGAGCIAAAASGAYLAVRQNAAESQAVVAAPGAAPAQPAETAARPVAETEAVVSSEAVQKAPVPPTAAEASPAAPEHRSSAPTEAVKAERETPRVSQAPRSRPSTAPASNRTARQRAPEQPVPAQPRERREAADVSLPPVAAPPASRGEVAEVTSRPETPPPPQFDELLIPASSVIGLRVETPLSTERSQVEDRVNARVTRDVMADGRVAIPAGAQAIGSVTLVERGGKIKERARLGVRFHTLVLADGTELPITTEAIYREGEPPAGESTRKIGGAAVGGAILGALIGGKKGAIVGATTGAAGGTAVVMAGDRNAATLPTGTIVTVRVAAPVSVEVEKR